jgi:NAD(P)-dependent dehydrogenase (short-subunit alcohol dehydrogenase family)
MDIEGASAIITGGASGLGEATARALHARGAHVVLLDMNADKGEALAAELGERCSFAQTDVTNEEQVQAAIATAVKQGPLRVAVNCAGIGWVTRTVNREGQPHDLGIFGKVIQVNLIGTFNVLRLAAAQMAQNEPQKFGERGVIINTASVAAYDGQIGQIAYAASKAGVVGLTLPAARDLSKVGVRVMTIAPGTFDTPMLALLPQEARDALAAGIPFPQKLGSPEEYGQLAAHIVENPYLNGETIRIDGALRMPPK